MADTWITDMRHYLDGDGLLAVADLPGPALNLALFQGSIVAWITSAAGRNNPRTNVYCRRSPCRQRCPGEIHAVLEEGPDRILWECPICGDKGLITGWEGTEWDRRRPQG